MKRAIYAFSGDPITYGHINIIDRAASMFDEVVVAIGVNPDKLNKYMFTLEERTEMAKRALANKRNVSVTSFEGMLPYFAYEQDIPVIVRGVRNAKDVEDENLLRKVIASQNLDIEVIPLLAKPELEHVSSSTAKAVQLAQGAIQNYVPLTVKQNLEARVSGQYIVGITGEIGSGKSYVGKKLAELALQKKIPVHYIDMDKIGHEILGDLEDAAYKNVRHEIAEVFGSGLMNPDGSIDRKALGNIVFNDSKKLSQLNRIMHNPITVQLSKYLLNRKGLVFLEAALFAENKANYLCNNNIILVKADEKSQLRRLGDKRKMNVGQIEKSRACQYDFDKKLNFLEQSIGLENQGKLWVYENSDDSGESKLAGLFSDIITNIDQYGELRFRALWERVGADGTPDEVYQRLLKEYSQPYRHYHTLKHVVNSLDELEGVRHLLENPAVVEWGLWHHDEIMKEQSRVNEERSAQSAYRTAKHALLSDEFAEQAKKIVLATKHDKIPQTNDEKYAADIDLAVLGKPPEKYDEYEGNIRKEYSWVDEETFWKRRTDILDRFLKRKNIYSTDFFKEKYEAQARINLGDSFDE